MDKKSVEVAASFARKIKRAFRIDKIILFGSRARGDHLKSSDYDLLVVSPDFKGVRIPDRMAKILAFWGEKNDLEVLCYTPEEFNSMKNRLTIVRQALKEGIAI